MVKMAGQLVAPQYDRERRTFYAEERIVFLDGIRGLAILLVGIGHFFYDFYIFKFTWIGLNLFFVLSGYLITKRLYVHYGDGITSYFKNFYIRRILRIFPLYYGCLFIFFVILPLCYSSFYTFYNELYSLQGWYWAYASNWMIIIHGFPDQPIFFHFWSLAVEEQFYIVWPFLFLLLVRIRWNYFLIILLITSSIFLRNTIGTNYDSYLHTGTVAEPLLAGALITVLEEKKKLESWYRIFFIVVLLFLSALIFILINNPNLEIVTNNWLFRVGYTAIDFIWAFILMLCLLDKKLSVIFRRILAVKWLTWLGKYSYGIYVFHWIILQIFVYKIESELIQRGLETHMAYFSTRLAGIILILSISYMSYNFYEKKFLRLKKYFI